MKNAFEPEWNETFTFLNIPFSASVNIKVTTSNFSRDDQIGGVSRVIQWVLPKAHFGCRRK